MKPFLTQMQGGFMLGVMGKRLLRASLPVSDGRLAVSALEHGGIWTLILDESGNILRQKLYASIPDGGNMVLDQDGGLIYLGWYWTDVNPFKIHIFKLDPAGDILWERMFGGSADTTATVLQPLAEGGYIVAGGTEAFGAGGMDALVMKLDGQGHLPPGCPLELPVDAHVSVEDTFAVPVDTSAVVEDVATAQNDFVFNFLDVTPSSEIVCD